jgi:hypothetical protein
MGCYSGTGSKYKSNLVKRIVEHCFKAGAKEVYVFDHTCDKWVNTYKNSGIERAAKAAGPRLFLQLGELLSGS